VRVRPLAGSVAARANASCALVNTRRFPERSISGSASSPEPVVQATGSPPSEEIRQSVLLPERADEKTIDSPPAVHTGSPPRRASVVSCRASPPLERTTQRSPFGPWEQRKKA